MRFVYVCVALCALATSPANADPVLRLSIIGDSIALGTGREVCAIVKRERLDYRCVVNAKEGALSSDVARRLDPRADIVVISVCTNDKRPQDCARNITTIRQRINLYAKVTWIVPAYPVWAPDMITRAAAGFNDMTITFEPGRGSHMARIHPRDYERVAFDLMLLIVSGP